jgi:septal ring factor EnvC (AmiA/AmiB activator)
LVLLCALVLALSPCVAHGQSSTPTSQASEPLWQDLLEKTSSLPQAIDLFLNNLTTQIESLQASNKSLLDSNAQLQASNQSLQASNAVLSSSLKASQAQAATSADLLKASQKDLQNSTASIIKAQGEAKALELRSAFLKIGCWAAGVAAAAGAGYAVGHIMLHWW